MIKEILKYEISLKYKLINPHFKNIKGKITIRLSLSDLDEQTRLQFKAPYILKNIILADCNNTSLNNLRTKKFEQNLILKMSRLLIKYPDLLDYLRKFK